MLLIILDGAADKQNNSSFKKAKTPNLDFLAKNGKTGLMYTIDKKIAPESDQAMLSLLGFNPYKHHGGRGPLEALGYNFKIKKAIYIRCNMGLIKNNKIIDVQQNLTEKQYKKLRKAGIPIYKTEGHRSILIIRKSLSPKISNSHPGYKIIKNYVSTATPRNKPLKIRKVKPLERKARPTANLVNSYIEKSKNILKNKIILTRGSGNQLPKLKKLKNWALLADTPVEKAIGKITGMKIINKPKSNKQTALKIIKLLKKYKHLYVQIKSPDRFAHQGSQKQKIKAIEKIDKEFFKTLRKYNIKIPIIVTCDHATPPKLKAHSNDPVPLLIYGKGKDKVKEFNEKACKKGSLKIVKGINLLKTIQKL